MDAMYEIKNPLQSKSIDEINSVLRNNEEFIGYVCNLNLAGNKPKVGAYIKNISFLRNKTAIPYPEQIIYLNWNGECFKFTMEYLDAFYGKVGNDNNLNDFKYLEV
jgi:hypothetical protein